QISPANKWKLGAVVHACIPLNAIEMGDGILVATKTEMIAPNLRYAVRLLRRSPGLTAVAVCTMALGIGANTALFSVLDAVVLKSLPVRDPDRLVGLSLRNARGDRIIGFSYPLFSELRARNQALAGMVAISWADRLPLRLPPAAETETATVSMVSSDFFEVLG